MDRTAIQRVRHFNRAVTTEVGALDGSFLGRGRPLGEARVLCRIGPEGADVADIRADLRLDSGLMSRLLRSLEAQGLLEVTPHSTDRRRRIARPTAAGRAEIAAYDRLSDARASRLLARQSPRTRTALLAAMDRIACALGADSIAIETSDPTSPDARHCLEGYYADLRRLFDIGFDVNASLDPEPDSLRPPNGAFLVARLDGLPLGCCALKGTGGTMGEIKRLWTAPEARGLGLALRLMDAAETRARALGMTTLRLDTNKALGAAIALYRAHGWQEIAAFNAEPYAHHWFEKELSPGS